MYCVPRSQYIKLRKIFKGGEYSRAETIRGNTVDVKKFINNYTPMLEANLNSEVLIGSQPRHLAAIHINLRQPAHAVTFMQHNVSLNDNCFVCVKIMKFSKLTRNVHVASCLLVCKFREFSLGSTYS